MIWPVPSILRSIQRGQIYAYLMRRWVPHLRMSLFHTSMTSEKYCRGLAKLCRGDIILTTDNRALSTLCVPGNHTHALFCIGRFRGVMMCAEMTHKGYGEVAFCKPCFHSSRVVILRCEAFNWDYVQDMVEKCRSFAGTKYDTQFDLNDEEIYCSELVYHCDFEHRMQVKPSRAWGTGQLVVKPDDLLAATKNKVVYDSDDETQ